jgi:hypothetical protein
MVWINHQPIPDYVTRNRDDRSGSMLLKKVFRGVERIFSEALVPWSENDVGGHINKAGFGGRTGKNFGRFIFCLARSAGAFRRASGDLAQSLRPGGLTPPPPCTTAHDNEEVQGVADVNERRLSRAHSIFGKQPHTK